MPARSRHLFRLAEQFGKPAAFGDLALGERGELGPLHGFFQAGATLPFASRQRLDDAALAILPK